MAVVGGSQAQEMELEEAPRTLHTRLGVYLGAQMGPILNYLTMEYCNCILTRGGLYNEISPEPGGNPEGGAQGIS